MRMIPDDILEAVEYAYLASPVRISGSKERAVIMGVMGRTVLAERERCLSIVKAIETRNEAEAHLIETIVRRILGVTNDRS